MRGVGDLKGVADLRTAVSAHLRSTTRHGRVPYQEVLSFGMQKLRLERQLELLSKRQERTQRQLNEARTAIKARIREIQADDPPDSKKASSSGGLWRTMKVEY